MTRRAKLTPREEQRIVALRAEGLTFEVIAARVGCSKGSVWNALHAHAQASACSAGSAKVVEAPAIIGGSGDRVSGCIDAIAKVRGLSRKVRGKLA